MKRTLQYFTRPIGLVMALVMFGLPVLLTPQEVNACFAYYFITTDENCNFESDPAAYCLSECNSDTPRAEEECDYHCGTTVIGAFMGTCQEWDGHCDCVMECEEPLP